MICFYHKSDLDGLCSAAIVHRVHHDCELYPIDFGDRFPWDKATGEVIMVDFSLPIADMIKLSKSCKFTWIDHHKAIINQYLELDDANKGPWTAHVSVEKAACELVWEHFHPGEPIPHNITLLGRYDSWRKDEGDWDGETLPFQYGMKAVKPEPTDDYWDIIFSKDIGATAARIVTSNGKTVLLYLKRENEIMMRDLAFVANIYICPVCKLNTKTFNDFGVRKCKCGSAVNAGPVLVLNRQPTSSQTFESRWNPKFYKMMLSFCVGDRGVCKVSIYTTHKDVDCSAIAKQLGGGGHAGAAGFMANINQLFNLLGEDS